LKELEDYNWFPHVLRNFQMEYISFLVDRFKVYDGFIKYFITSPQPVQPMIDLCSGSGKPAINFFRKTNYFSQLLLTDKYPGKWPINDTGIPYETYSVDVLKMEFKPGTCYTMFNAFHHFSDKDKLKVTQKIQASGSGAFMMEIIEPDIICLLKVLFITTIGNLLLTPLIRPFSLKRLFFTYILPINMITITFDGLVSVLKSRSVKQYQKLFSNYGNAIEITRFGNGLTPLIVIKVKPKQ
jgi:hypothetical protein